LSADRIGCHGFNGDSLLSRCRNKIRTRVRSVDRESCFLQIGETSEFKQARVKPVALEIAHEMSIRVVHACGQHLHERAGFRMDR
jgi:hypothetical protein